MPSWARYRVFAWDEFLRLWCEDCYTEGNELGFWSEVEPVPVSEMIGLIVQHELAVHRDPPSSPTKLVRDGVPDAIRANGQIPITRTADTEEYVKLLREKLLEEVGEFLDAGPEGEAEELADVLEVVFALARLTGLGAVLAARTEKRKRLGTFMDRVVWEGNFETARKEGSDA